MKAAQRSSRTEVFSLVGLLLLVTTRSCGLAAESTNPILHTAEEVRRLSTEEAERPYRVHLEGVLTFFDQRAPDKAFRFLQDDTAGIYIFPPTRFTNAAAGQRVEVEGHTGRGDFAPVVWAEKIHVLGPGDFPAPKPVTFEQLSSGAEDSQFVEVRGVVRAVRLEEQRLFFIIEVATGEGRVTVFASELPVTRSEDLVDSTVRVRGVCYTQFNRQRQLFNFGLLVPRPEDLVVEKAAPEDPFALPTQPLKSLLQYSAQGSYGHRLKVAGTVTLRYGDRLYIQEGHEGLCVQTRQSSRVAVGDRVEVLGFPARGEYTPMMESGVYRKIEPGPPVSPDSVTADEALKGGRDCQLVTIEARLLERAQHSQEPFLVLQADGFVFHAYLHGTGNFEGLDRLEKGSKVSVTGVCVVEAVEDWHYGETWRAASFRVLMRTPEDVVVLQAPPWWTLGRLLVAVGLLVAVVVVAFGWVAQLRRRVQKQTHIIEEKLQAEAALKERFFEMLENANDVVFTYDLQGRLTSINHVGEQLMERPRSELLNRHVLEFVAPEQRAAAEQWLQQVLQGADMPTSEWDVVSASGQRVRLETNTRMIVQNGQPLEVEGIGRDITERKRLEKEILEIANKEQQRIGQDLHDGVCQQLAAIAFRTHSLARRLQDKVPAESSEAENIGELISESLNQTRGVARGLFPVRLEENGLVSALEELAATTASRFKINCTFVCEGTTPAMDNSVALHVYYIAQEAVLNAARHSKAETIAIRLVGQASGLTASRQPSGLATPMASQPTGKPEACRDSRKLEACATTPEPGDAQRLVLTVQDNGAGFVPNPGHRTGMGIAIMSYRARVIGANLDLKTQPGQGTQLSCGFQASSARPPANSHERPAT